MASDGQVVIDIEVDDRPVVRARDTLGSFTNSAESAGSATTRTGQEVQRASLSFKDLATSLGLVAVASKAMEVLSSAVSGAVSRFDILNGFPVVMDQIGFSAEQSQAAISKLSNGIDGLPTTLDTVASTTQKLAAMTGDLDGAVASTLALNNAFIASGSDAADASRGLLQYTQMLSTGKVDMMAWRTLQETMGIALNDVAKAFGFAGASAQNDLYDALKEGEITFDAFNAKIIELDGGVGGFADRARTVSGGIATSFGNLRNAATKGLANVLKAFNEISKSTTGKEIYQNLDALKVIVNSTFAAVVSAIGLATPAVQLFINVVKALIPVVQTLTPAILGLVAAYAAYTVINKANFAIQASNRLLVLAQISQTGLTLALKGSTAAQVSNTGAVSLGTLAIGLMTGKITIATAAQVVATAATTAWGVAVKFLLGPVGWVTAAIGLLVTGIIAAVNWFKKSSEEADKLNKSTVALSDSTNSLKEGLNGTKDAYREQVTDLQATSAATESLANKMVMLSEMENKSAADKELMKSRVDQLNESVAGLNLMYNAESDTLSMSSEEIAKRIQLMNDQTSLADAQARQLEIEKEQHEIGLKLAETNTLREEWNQKLEDGSIKGREHKAAMEELDAQEKTLMDTTASLGMQYEMTEYQTATALEGITSAVEAGVISQKVAFGELNEYQQEVVVGMSDSWRSYKDAATDMFDTIETKSDITAKKMTENLLSNQKAVNEWSVNIAKLAEKGIDQGLLDTIRNAGPEAAGLVSNLVKSSDDELKKLSDAFAKGGDVATKALNASLGKENAGVMDAVGHLVTQAGESFNEQVQRADFTSLGGAIPEGAAAGITAGTKDAVEASKKMAEEVKEGFTGPLDIKSPSGVFEEAGLNVTQGTDNGIKKGTPAVVTTMKNLAKAMKEPFLNVKTEYAEIGGHMAAGMNQGLNAGKSAIMTTAKGIAASALTAMRVELDIHSPAKSTDKIGRQTGQGFVQGMNKMQKEIEKAGKAAAKKAAKGVKDGAKESTKKAEKEAASAAKKAAAKAKSDAKAVAKAQADGFKEAFDSASYKFKMGEIDAGEYIASLEKIKKSQAKLPEQARKIGLEINKVTKDNAKELQKIREDEIKAQEDALKAQLDRSKEYIDRHKYYDNMSKTEELAAWERVQKQYKVGTEQRMEADREVYRLKKEINAELIKMTEDYSKKINSLNDKLNADVLKAQQDEAKQIANIQKKAADDEIKIREDAAKKEKDIRDKSAADQLAAWNSYLAQVDSDTKKYNNVGGGLFNYFQIEKAEDPTGLIEILESQYEALEQFDKEMAALGESSIDKGLLEELRAMGPDALPELKAFNAMTEEQMEQYSQIYRDKAEKARKLAEIQNAGMKEDTLKNMQAIRDAANSELSQLAVDTSMQIANMRNAANAEMQQIQYDTQKNIADMRLAANTELELLQVEWTDKIKAINTVTKEELKDLKTIGKNAGQGLMDGLSSMEGALVAKARSIAEAVKSAMAGALDIHSPSRWMRDFLVGNMTAGFLQGIDKDEDRILAGARKFAEFMMPNAKDVIIPSMSFLPFDATMPTNNPVIGSSAGGSTWEPKITNYFTPAESTPSESARKQKNMLVELGMQLNV